MHRTLAGGLSLCFCVLVVYFLPQRYQAHQVYFSALSESLWLSIVCHGCMELTEMRDSTFCVKNALLLHARLETSVS